ncbi:Ca2+-dependent lipid-binding protein, contains C2 domain [Geosmithia morbida]|uniref:Ca2+-dependent lipid-binding protein, contains C2 domain n=1 Tax=Geosmithia morbida TaxID=1094350 RepID=A0A9P4YXG1_9HYPO|nr:Ca2+-dependent lipid-binding protein, contains C2 domain [Geosmithia morbida]KAF4123579.1 Ca2+-dependent lipid-binding protein, contains C2 domain [Geosmithia morbida]
MSTASRLSWGATQRLRSSTKSETRSRADSRAQHTVVDHEDARSFALRTAYLHYLLQPKAKKKQYVSAPKPAPRSQTSIGQLIQEYGSGNSSSLKLPHNFSAIILARVGGVVKGQERLPGFNDAAVKRSFAEVYTAFSDPSFRKSIDRERKFEPLVLIFYSRATEAAKKGCAPDDDSWKLIPDRHLALFVRLTLKTLRDHGHDKDKPELASRLSTLENKLLTNDQNLVGGSSDSTGGTIEVAVPLSYEVKDMPLVQVVAAIFGLSLSDVQAEINENRQTWTEEAALRDLKSYQLRLSANMPGALGSQDFDIDESFDEWKKSEGPCLSAMMLDILTAKPLLARTSTGPTVPSRPQSMVSDDQVYAELGRALSNASNGGPAIDPSLNLGSLAIGDRSSIRTVEAHIYTFIPPDPRAFYKYILQQAMTFDQLHADPELDYQPLSKQSVELLADLSVRWRVPQSSRLICLLEVAARKFMDQEIIPEELDAVFDCVKGPQPELKKPPHIHGFSTPLNEIETSRWTIHDLAAYQHTLYSLYDAILRELYNLMEKCYDAKAPQMGPVMFILENHITNDPTFSPRPETASEFAEQLSQRLRQRAVDVYREYMQKEIPVYKEDWEFGHVVKLGKSVTKLCDRIRKRFQKMPEIMGVDPLEILVEEVFPSFEEDANAILQAIMLRVQDEGGEIDIQDGFDLYQELVEIRRIHERSLPSDHPFAFDIETLLVDFVWRWIRIAEGRMVDYVDEAIKQDQFQVRSEHPGQITMDSERHSVSIIDLFMLFNQTRDQVDKLEWNNELHVARFRTALAKSFSAGIGHYCEVVEQKFAHEMDRPSAEELATQSMSTQEKWMQLAKDAWNNKEKAEPFQFYPESFVKLNNIEYAMQEFDKLEKKMNPDYCATLIEKADASASKKRSKKQPSKYTFTIKVIEAEDLKACDSSGFSDPYVVFGDEYQKRLYKTRIIHRNLNPRWDESFDVTVQGPVNMIATIWDYDTFGDHDYVGRTSLKLDPFHFRDYLPREFWLDLDSQGRILIRVSMEGERDDIHFHFGRAFRHLKRTERDMVRKITDKLTSQISATLSHNTLRSLLGTGSIGAAMTGYWKKRTSTMPVVTTAQIEGVLTPLFEYFDDNFAIMKQTLTDQTMIAVMTRLWKEVLMTIENLVVPPLSEKPSMQKPLASKELDIVYHWLQKLFEFFNAKDEVTGEQEGVPESVLKSPKWHELKSVNYWYFEDTNMLIRESERMAAATAQRAQQALQQQQQQQQSSRPESMSHAHPPASASPGMVAMGGFASMGTIRRGKSIFMSRNLGTMRKAKEEKWREAQADPSDDVILRILRMRPEAAGYLKERHRQKERQAATAAAALIVKNSVNQGWNAGGHSRGASSLARNALPKR